MSVIAFLYTGRSKKLWPPITTCGNPRTDRASAIGRAIAFVRHRTAIAPAAVPTSINRAASAAMESPSVTLSGQDQSSTFSPDRLPRPPLSSPPPLFAVHQDAPPPL